MNVKTSNVCSQQSLWVFSLLVGNFLWFLKDVCQRLTSKLLTAAEFSFQPFDFLSNLKLHKQPDRKFPSAETLWEGHIRSEHRFSERNYCSIQVFTRLKKSRSEPFLFDLSQHPSCDSRRKNMFKVYRNIFKIKGSCVGPGTRTLKLWDPEQVPGGPPVSSHSWATFRPLSSFSHLTIFAWPPFCLSDTHTRAHVHTSTHPVPAGFEAETTPAFACDIIIEWPLPVETVR